MDTDGAIKSTIDGRWQLVRAEMDGEVAPELLTTKTELEFKSGEYIVRFGGDIMDSGTFEFIDTSGSNKLFLRGRGKESAERIIPCLVQHVGERIRICYGLNGNLPVDFKTAKGQLKYSAIYRRKSSA